MLAFLQTSWSLRFITKPSIRVRWRTLTGDNRVPFQKRALKPARPHALLISPNAEIGKQTSRTGQEKQIEAIERGTGDDLQNGQMYDDDGGLETTLDRGEVERLQKAGLGVIVLKRGKSRLFHKSRPTALYSGGVSTALDPADGKLSTGSVVAVVDGRGHTVAHGVYNGESMFRVRLLSWTDEHTNNMGDVYNAADWTIDQALSKRIREAVEIRTILGLPSENTNAYRVVNGEGDRLPGLFIDRFGTAVVVSCAAAWCVVHKASILRAVRDIIVPSGLPKWSVIWRVNEVRLKQDGVDPATFLKTHALHNENDSVNTVDIDTKVIAKENGILFQLDGGALNAGQKTGHYADQRESRAFVRELLTRRKPQPTKLLDLFSYSGGFSLHGVTGLGHVHATAVDSSERALDALRKNAELNSVTSQMTIMQGDVERVVNECVSQGLTYDIVIVDPPKYAPTTKTLARAWGKYKRVNTAAIRAVASPGILVTCSCSAAVSSRRPTFVQTVVDAAKDAGRDATLIRTMGAAPDHPVPGDQPETEYLTVCVFAIR